MHDCCARHGLRTVALAIVSFSSGHGICRRVCVVALVRLHFADHRSHHDRERAAARIQSLLFARHRCWSAWRTRGKPDAGMVLPFAQTHQLACRRSVDADKRMLHRGYRPCSRLLPLRIEGHIHGASPSVLLIRSAAVSSRSSDLGAGYRVVFSICKRVSVRASTPAAS